MSKEQTLHDLRTALLKLAMTRDDLKREANRLEFDMYTKIGLAKTVDCLSDAIKDLEADITRRANS